MFKDLHLFEAEFEALEGALICHPVWQTIHVWSLTLYIVGLLMSLHVQCILEVSLHCTCSPVACQSVNQIQ